MKLLSLFLAFLVLSPLAGPGHAADWKPLHNGKDWTGWNIFIKGDADNEDPRGFFSLTEEGWIHTYRDTPESEKVNYGVFQTEKAYSHYRLRFQYKWGKKRFAPRKKMKRDAGLLFHCYTDDRELWSPGGFPLSLECQVQEGDTGDLWLVQTRANIPLAPGGKQKAGKFLPEAAGGIAEQRTGGRVLKNPDSDRLEGWNDVEVEVLGSRSSRYWVNGVLVLELENLQRPAIAKGKLDRSRWVPLAEGKLAFQCEAAEVFYRGIEILELPEEAKRDPDLPLSPLAP